MHQKKHGINFWSVGVKYIFSLLTIDSIEAIFYTHTHKIEDSQILTWLSRGYSFSAFLEVGKVL